jgi:hypothetical protein
MQTRLRLLHDWGRQVRALLPGVRATRATALALFALGALWAGNVTLLKVAAALPLAAADPSTERRLRRWLANPKVDAAGLWGPLLRAALAGRAGRELVLAFDPTPHRDRFTVLALGVVCHKRVLPVAWRVVPQQRPWPDRLGPLFAALAAQVAAALPAGCAVTVVADRGLAGPALVDACRAAGWHLVLRLRAGAGEAAKARLADGREVRLAELVGGPGQRWQAPAAVFKGAGWRAGWLTIRWARGAAEPWVLFSDRPGGGARVREYRRRALAEATYADGKGRGWAVERSKLADAARLERLLLALAVALWWAHQLGLRAIRAGQRRRFDRADRRDLSVVRLGRRRLEDLLLHGHPPPLPFRRLAGAWRYAWLA